MLQHSGTEMVLVRCTSRKDLRVIQVDLAHIVGLVSQSMHQTVQCPWALGRRRPAYPKAHRRVNTPYCHIGRPPAIHAEAAAGLSLWSALASQSASCLCTSYGIYHTLRGAWSGVEAVGRPPTPSLHATTAVPFRPLVHRLHHTAPDHLRPLVTTITTQVLCRSSHDVMTERAHQPIS